MSVYTPFYGYTYGGFPSGPLDMRTELYLGTAGTGWDDISSYVLQREGTSPPVTIETGRPDEKSTASPSSYAAQWNNRDARFSPRAPAGAYYGQLNRNTPLRVSVPGSGTSLRIEDDPTSAAATAGAAAGVTGDIDIRLEMDLSNWMPCSLAASVTDWSLVLNGDGTIGLLIGAITLYSSTQPIPLGHGAIRVTRAASAGVMTFWTSATIGGTWTQLGATVASTAGALGSGSGVLVGYDSVAALVLGYGAPSGRFYAFQLLNGIGGTPVANPDFTAQAPGTINFTDAAGTAWNVGGTSTIDGRCYLGHFECSGLPQRWDPTGTDVWTPVAGSGLLRRLQAGNSPAPSAMRRAVISQAGVVAYWPGEDPQGATQIASGLPGGQPMMFTGTPGFQGESGSPSADSTFACSSQLIQVQQSSWAGTVPVYTSAGNDAVTFLLDVPSGGLGAGSTLLTVAAADGNSLSVLYTTGSGGSLAIYENATSISVSPLTAVNGVPMLVQLANITSSGSAVLTILPLGDSAVTDFTSGISTVTGQFTAVVVNQNLNNNGDLLVGHIWVTSAAADITALQDPLNAWDGESAAARFARLCRENSVQPRIYGYPDSSAVMGAQPIDTLANLLGYCETSDRGMLYEPSEVLGLGYRTLSSLCSQSPGAVFDYTAAELGGDGSDGLEPEDDDQYTVNDATISRNNGSSVQVQVTEGTMSVQPPPDGVGDYATAITVYTAEDSGLADIAGWVTHAGTCDEERYPVIPMNLARPALEGLVYDIQDMRLGGYAQISNLPDWTAPGPAKQLVYGKTIKLGGLFYQVAWNAVPESPYETIVLDDVVYGRLDTDGSTLATAASPAATALSVATTNPGSPLWTTDPADFPFDVSIGGEQITVTDIGSGAITVTAAAGGSTAHGILLRLLVLDNAALAGSPATASQSAAAAHQASITTTGAGSQVYGAIVDAFAATVPPDAGCTMIDNVVDTANVQCYASFSAGPAGTPGAATVGTVASFPGGMAALEVIPDGGTITTGASSPAVAENTGGSSTSTAAFTPPAGSLLVAIVDAAGGAGVATMAVTTSGLIWTEQVKGNAAGNGYTGVWTATVPAATSPQAFTVARSVNGVVKAQASGADVRLLNPPVPALA